MPAAADIRTPGPASGRAFFGVLALLFAAGAAVTIAQATSMAEMGEIPLSGGWMLSMIWMPMCEQTWLSTAASFLGMWSAMTVTMMLPPLAPMLWRYRQALYMTGEAHADRLMAAVGLGYLFLWTLAGMVIFVAGAVLAEAVQQLPPLARFMPLAAGLLVLLAGILQLSPWKARHLACCRTVPTIALPADIGMAWRHGLSLGLHCSLACAGLTMLLLVLGIMDWRAMAAVMAAVTAERLAPAGERIARSIGAAVIGTGLVLTARAAGLG